MERKRVQSFRTSRPNQAAFRKEVLRACQRCVITNVTMPEILEAAHIKPFKYNGEDTVANGFAMRADIHTLFDAGHLRISVDGVADYLDESRSVWDREDNVYYFMAYSRMHFHDASAEVECEVRLGFPDDGSMKPIEIQSVRITNKRDICIDVSDAEVTYEDITDYGEDAWRAEQAEALQEYHSH